jgi:hypothetical protein
MSNLITTVRVCLSRYEEFIELSRHETPLQG